VVVKRYVGAVGARGSSRASHQRRVRKSRARFTLRSAVTGCTNVDRVLGAQVLMPRGNASFRPMTDRAERRPPFLTGR